MGSPFLEALNAGIANNQRAQQLGLQRSQLEQALQTSEADRALRSRALDLQEGQHYVDPASIMDYLPKDVRDQLGTTFSPGKKVPATLFQSILTRAGAQADLARQDTQARTAGQTIKDFYTTTDLAPGTTLERPPADAGVDLAPPSPVPTQKTTDPKMAFLADMLPTLVRNKEIGAEVMGVTLPKPVIGKPGEVGFNPTTGKQVFSVPKDDPTELLRTLGLIPGTPGVGGEPGNVPPELLYKRRVGVTGDKVSAANEPVSDAERNIHRAMYAEGWDYKQHGPAYWDEAANRARQLIVPPGGQALGTGTGQPFVRSGPPGRASAAPASGNAAQAPTIAADAQRFRADAAQETDPARKAALLASADAADRLVSGQGPAQRGTPGAGRTPMKGTTPPVSETVVQDLRGQARLRRAAQQVEAALATPGIDKYIGPYGQYGSTVQGKAPFAALGKIPAPVVQLEQNLATIKNYTIKLITGAQMSEQEARRITQELPDQSSQPGVLRQRFKTTQENIRQMEETTRRLALRGDQQAILIATELGLMGPGQPGAAATPQPAPGAEARQVRIRDSKTGRTGTVMLGAGETLPAGLEEVR